MPPTHEPHIREVVLDGHSLTLSQLVAVARGLATPSGGRAYPVVRLAPETVANLRTVRKFVDENWLSDASPVIYGFNTGVGPLKDKHISAAEIDRFQENLIRSHAACIGDAAPQDVVRATMLIRANALARGVSGIRVEVVERLLAMLNAGVHPFIPEQGSVGASGDLGPLAHLAIALMGDEGAEAFLWGERMAAAEALSRAGIAPSRFSLAAKDGLAMVNGCSFSLGFGALALHDAWQCLHTANLAAAMSMEAMRGELAAFDARIHEARNHPGQMRAAEDVRALLSGSRRTTDEARKVLYPFERRDGEWKPRVQDAYTLRCVPQVHGATWDTLTFAEEVMTREMNAATDNPLIFPTADGAGYEALSGGNFHGEHLAFATDFLAIAVHELGNISERRSSRQLDPNLSYGLPRNLIGATAGVNTGFPVCQCAASALVMESRTLCGPASADSIPNKCSQEDHVSMATWSARKARMVIENTFKVLGIELFCACQAVSLGDGYLSGMPLAPATARTHAAFRRRVPFIKDDVYMNPHMRAAFEMAKGGELLAEAWRG